MFTDNRFKGTRTVIQGNVAVSQIKIFMCGHYFEAYVAASGTQFAILRAGCGRLVNKPGDHVH